MMQSLTKSPLRKLMEILHVLQTITLAQHVVWRGHRVYTELLNIYRRKSRTPNNIWEYINIGMILYGFLNIYMSLDDCLVNNFTFHTDCSLQANLIIICTFSRKSGIVFRITGLFQRVICCPIRQRGSHSFCRRVTKHVFGHISLPTDVPRFSSAAREIGFSS